MTETVIQAQGGDIKALQALYEDAYKSVYYIAFKVLKNQNDAEDIAQEVFITVFEKIQDLREPAAFYGWVKQITLNKCTSFLRKQKKLPAFDDEHDIVEQMENDGLQLPDKALDDVEVRQIILSVIDNLPVEQKICVLYYYYEELSIAEIAEALEIKETTVKNRLALARNKIRAELERKEREEGIKLYAFPLLLRPILEMDMRDFAVPQGSAEKVWRNVKSKIEQNGFDNGEPPDTSGQVGPKLDEAVNAGKAETNMKMALGTKILLAVVSVVVVGALVVGGVILVPRLLGNSADSSTPTAQRVADNGEAESAPTQSPGDNAGAGNVPEQVTNDASVPTSEINHAAHVSTEFAVQVSDGRNQLLSGVILLFDGEQPKLTLEDVSDVVLTKDGQSIDVNISLIHIEEIGGGSDSVQTSYRMVFSPSYSVPTTGSGTYSFTCNIQGVGYSTGDYYFDW